MKLIMIVKLIEVVDKFLVVFNSEVLLHLFHIINLFLVGYQLLLHFRDHLVTAFIALLDIGIAPMEFFGLITHIFKKLVLKLRCR